MSVIKLVQGDNLPEITLTLTDRQTGAPIDLSASTTTVVVKLRAADSNTLLATLPCVKVDPGNGVVKFGFPGTTLDVAPGQYVGEIEMNFGGQILSVFDLLNFYLRQQF
jgi:hypothetical protein